MKIQALIQFAYPYRHRLLLVGLIMLTEVMVTLSIPWLGGHLAGNLIDLKSIDLGLIVGLLLIALALQALLRFLSRYMSGKVSENLLADLRDRIYRHVQSLPIEFHHSRRQGEIIALITYEAAQLSNFLSSVLVSLLPLSLTITGATILMLSIDKNLAIFMVSMVFILSFSLKLFSRNIRGLAASLQQAQSEAVGIVQQNLEMMPAIKYFVKEDDEAERYAAQLQKAKRLSLKQQLFYAAIDPAVHFLSTATIIMTLWFANQSLHSGAMSSVDLIRILLLAAVIARPLASLANVYGQIQTARGTLARLHDVLSADPESGYSGVKQIEKLSGEISFNNVSFAYPSRDGTIQSVNLHIQPGETIALVGENGSGKSTMIELLLRMYEPTEGAIKVDGIDIKELNVSSLRRQIGIVPQRILLFNGSVLDNIAYGKYHASKADVIEAAKLAQAHEFIMALPDAYETEIGDRGIRLSGGQSQRIALARALLKNPAILILDEATSMFDLEGEDNFIEASKALLKNRTVVLITHRPAILAVADRILYFAKGQIQKEIINHLPFEHASETEG